MAESASLESILGKSCVSMEDAVIACVELDGEEPVILNFTHPAAAERAIANVFVRGFIVRTDEDGSQTFYPTHRIREVRVIENK